ncbi:MAG: DsbA family protein [Candidatus Aenigmarchaeota archaeon]|nr:DsbA family protein [Candidatus Aenigmarchaeota archaeon]
MGKKLSKKEKKRLKYIESRKKVETEKIQKPKKIPKILIFGLIVALVIILWMYYTKNTSTYIPRKNDVPLVGNANATVTIKSFSDFQCFYCAEFYKKVYPEIKTKYIETGKVKFLFYDFPIEEIHPLAMKAAEAAKCAHEQGRYEEYALLLYSRQKEWSKVGVGKFKEYAKELGLSEEFFKCLDSGVMREMVKRDLEEGKKLQVYGTPTFFVNERRIVGAKSFEEFEKVINEILLKNNLSGFN